MTKNLDHVLLIPKNDDDGTVKISFEELFDHMYKFQQMQHTSSKDKGLVEYEILPL